MLIAVYVACGSQLAHVLDRWHPTRRIVLQADHVPKLASGCTAVGLQSRDLGGKSWIAS